MSETTPSPQDFPILVDFPDEEGGLVQVSLKDDVAEWLEKSQDALDKAMLTILGMAYRANQLRHIPTEFTQAEIEFGVKLTAESGALLAKAGAEGSISVKLTWERQEKM